MRIATKMRLPLIHATLLFLSFLYPASALPGFLNNWPSHVVFGQFQVTFPFSLLLETPSGFDFWRSAKELGDKVVQYTNGVLHDAAIQYAAAAEQIDEFKVSMTDVVSKTQAMRDGIHDGLKACELNIDDISEMFSVQMASVLEDLKAEFSEPLPEEETARYHQRAVMVSRALDMVEDEFVKVSGVWGTSEDDARKSFGSIKPQLSHVLLVTGNIIDNHPVLLETIIISGAFMLIPEGWILRPLLTIFGFGPSGPVKGSPAAWAQRQFWGGAVKEGSWFARLQSAGMKWPSKWCQKVAIPVALSAGVVGTMFGSGCGRIFC